MSLDVYLLSDFPSQNRMEEVSRYFRRRIFIREGGSMKEINAKEWKRRFPFRDPVVVQPRKFNEVYTANITHNLAAMAREAGIYMHLWHPEQIGISLARELIGSLRKAVETMKADPERFRKHNPPNGWGDYDMFVKWLEAYLEACEENPLAHVAVSG